MTAPLLHALARALAAAPGAEARACRERVARVISGDEESLDAAFGLKPGPGERSWRTISALQRRDDLIRQVAAEHYAGMTAREAGERISIELGRFRNSHDWRRSRAATTCPFTGPKAKWWQILRLIDRPIGASRIRQILANERPPIDWPERGRNSDQQ